MPLAPTTVHDQAGAPTSHFGVDSDELRGQADRQLRQLLLQRLLQSLELGIQQRHRVLLRQAGRASLEGGNESVPRARPRISSTPQHTSLRRCINWPRRASEITLAQRCSWSATVNRGQYDGEDEAAMSTLLAVRHSLVRPLLPSLSLRGPKRCSPLVEKACPSHRRKEMPCHSPRAVA